MRALVLGIAFLAGSLQLSAQEFSYYDLPSSLNEISGLELINDSLLVGFNDGGNDPDLYLMNLKGKVIKTVDIKDAYNKDWEDIASDGKYLYIGDIGNNLNKRRKLNIYRVKIDDVLNKRSVESEEIVFKYKEQKEYPPDSEALFYDAEGMVAVDDSIWVFTKNRAANSDGKSWIYKIPTKPGEYTVEHTNDVYFGTDGWMIDGITAVDAYSDTFYFLTYNRYVVKKWTGKKFTDISEYEFESIAQRESLVVYNENTIFVADEKNRLLGEVKLYKIRTDRD